MRKLVVAAFLGLAVFCANAQESETFTDEDLTSYATVMAWAETEQQKLTNLVIDSVETWLADSPLTNARYNDLSKASKDGILDEVEATEEELSTFADIQQRIEDKKQVFIEEYKTRIKEDIGAGLYNKLKGPLKSDMELKARYEAILTNLKKADVNGEATGNSEE